MNTFSSHENLKKGINYYKDAIKLQKNGNYISNLARTYQYISGAYLFDNNLDSAIYYGEKSLSIWFDLGEKSRLGGQYHNLGNLYSFAGNMTKALQYFTESEKYFGHNGYSWGRAFLYLKEKDYEKAIEIWNYFLHIVKAKNQDDPFNEAQLLLNLGEVYYLQGSTEKAIDIFSNALEIFEDNYSEHKELQVDHHLVLSWSLQTMLSQSSFDNTEKLKKLIDFVGNDIKTFLNEGYPFYENRIKLLLNLANINKKLGNHSQVNRIYHECLSMASNQRIKSNPIILKLMEEIEL